MISADRGISAETSSQPAPLSLPWWTPALGAALRRTRTRASLTRAQLAARLSVSPESIRRWERGGSKPSPAAVLAYLAAVGSDLSALREIDLAGESPTDDGRAPDVGQRIRAHRQHLGLTQAECARIIGVAQPTLAGWEIRRATPGRELAPAIADFLDEPLVAVESMLAQPLDFEMSTWPLFGRIIGERRLALQMDRPQLAARMHVSPRTIAAWELGEKVPNNSHLPRLAELLGIEPSVLVSALPEPKPSCELGRIILRCQRMLGLSRDEIAIACAVTPVTVGRWIWGRNVPTDTNIEQLARVLEVNVKVVQTAVDLGMSDAADLDSR